MKSVADDDPEMNAAIARAQETLPLFIAALQSPKASQTMFSIKGRFPYGDDNQAEHVWISDLFFDGTQFEGTLDNDPIYVEGLYIGDRVKVQESNVSDWIIVDDGKLLGGFTIYVLRNQMTEEERQLFDEENGFSLGDDPVLP